MAIQSYNESCTNLNRSQLNTNLLLAKYGITQMSVNRLGPWVNLFEELMGLHMTS